MNLSRLPDIFGSSVNTFILIPFNHPSDNRLRSMKIEYEIRHQSGRQKEEATCMETGARTPPVRTSMVRQSVSLRP